MVILRTFFPYSCFNKLSGNRGRGTVLQRHTWTPHPLGKREHTTFFSYLGREAFRGFPGGKCNGRVPDTRLNNSSRFLSTYDAVLDLIFPFFSLSSFFFRTSGKLTISCTIINRVMK